MAYVDVSEYPGIRVSGYPGISFSRYPGIVAVFRAWYQPREKRLRRIRERTTNTQPLRLPDKLRELRAPNTNSFLLLSKLRVCQSGRTSERRETATAFRRRGRHLGAASRANPRTRLCSARRHVNTSVSPCEQPKPIYYAPATVEENSSLDKQNTQTRSFVFVVFVIFIVFVRVYPSRACHVSLVAGYCSVWARQLWPGRRGTT